jgi:hypothetical protein
MRVPPIFHLSIMPSIQIAAESIHCALGPPLACEKEEIEAFFNTIAQFTNARSVHSAFYQ